MPRPLLSPDALRKPFEIYLTDAERRFIEDKSMVAGLGLSPFIRQTALGQKVSTIPQPNVEKWEKLSRLSSSLNQLTKAVNAGTLVSVNSFLLYEVSEAVRLLRLDLLGTAEET